MEKVILIGGLFIVLPYMIKMLPYLVPKHVYDQSKLEKVPLTELNNWGHHTEEEYAKKNIKLDFQDITQEQWEKIDWSNFDYNTFNKTY